MLRFFGILIVCLSTLIGSVVHASTMAVGSLEVMEIKSAYALQTCSTGQIVVSETGQSEDVGIASKTTGAARCQVEMEPLNDQPDFANAHLDLVVFLHKSPAIEGVVIAPPHGPPRTVSVVHFS